MAHGLTKGMHHGVQWIHAGCAIPHAMVFAPPLIGGHGLQQIRLLGPLWRRNLDLFSFCYAGHGASENRFSARAARQNCSCMLDFALELCQRKRIPLLGLAFKPLFVPLVGNELYLGVLYLCALPATVQSAIAFTSLARGNVPAAICSAAASSLLGIFLTPLLVMLLLGASGDTGSGLDAVLKITLQLLVPFVAGQIARRWIGAWVKRNARWLKVVDQGSILLVVYTAFSEAVVTGLWHTVSPQHLAGLFVVCAILLAVVLFGTRMLGKALGFDLEDRITILFAGSKKSLATGVPCDRQVCLSHGWHIAYRVSDDGHGLSLLAQGLDD